jgi:Cadherin-like beta sandwich domain
MRVKKTDSGTNSDGGRLMQFRLFKQNNVWIVLFSILAVLFLNACSDANNVTGPPEPVPLSPDAKLSSLTVNTGSLHPAFSSNIANYTVDVATSVSSVTVTARPQNADASMTLNGEATAPDQARTITLESAGNTPIPIVVTAVNGSQNTYIVTVRRAAPGGNNNLQSLTVSPGALTPSFNASRLVYTVNVASTVGSVTVTAQPQDSGATVSIDGQPTTSQSVSLGAAGSSTEILIEVMAPNGSLKTYAVTVNRAAIVPSGNNNLSGLVVSAGPLAPPFDAGTTSYDVQAPIGTADTTVTATVADSTATLTINGSPATSGVASASIPLALGANPISIVVAAENGTSKSYTVTITRTL